MRVTKPRIPESVFQNYEKMESVKIQYLIASEKQKVIEKEAETDRMQKLINTKANAEVSQIINEKKLREQKSNKIIQEIESNSTI